MSKPARHETVTHRARLTHDRVMAASIAAHSRPLPSVWWKVLALFVALAAAISIGHTTAFSLVQMLPFEWMFTVGPWVPTVVPALFCLAAVLFVDSLFQWNVGRAYLKNFDRIGIPREIDATYDILPEGLRLTTPRVTIFPKWGTIDTIEDVGDGWAISADHQTFFLPRDSFGGVEDERRFLRALVAHLGDLARSRSPFAIAFAEADVPHRPAPPLDPATSGSASVPSVRKVQAPDLVARGLIARHELTWASQVAFYTVTKGRLHGFAYPALSALAGGLTGLSIAAVILLLPPLSITLGNVLLFAGVAFVLPLLGSAIGLYLGNSRLRTVLDRVYHQALYDRSSPAEAECEWEVLPEGLALRSDRVTLLHTWPSISEVLRHGEYWIALADMTSVTIPRRIFASEDAERAFLAALLGHISEKALARSKDAAEFVAAGTQAGA